MQENIDIRVREDGSRVAARNIRSMGDAADDAKAGIGNLQQVLIGLAGAGTLMAIASMADEFTNLQNRLRLVTTDSSNLALITKSLGDIANETRSDFVATADLYARMASSAKDLGLSQKELLGFTKSLNQAVILSGASASEAAGGIRQLSQGMASGVLRGDELNSILENLPPVADVIAEHMGVTRGQLRALGEDGKISADIIVEAFKAAEEQLAKGFATTVPTLSQSFAVLKNNVMLWIGEMDRSYGITAGLAQMILTLSNNLDTLLPILAGVAAAIAAAFAPAVIIAFMAQIRALWALMLANPFVAVAAVVTGLLTTLYLMRDEIKLGIDETTTLGDLMRAAWESVGPLIQSVADIAAQFFGWLSDTSGGTFTQLIDDVNGYEHASESMWLKILRTVIKVFDMIGAVIRGTIAGVGAVIEGNISRWTGLFNNMIAGYQAVAKGDFSGAVASATANVDIIKNVGGSAGAEFKAAFDKELERQQGGGLEALLDQTIARAQEISKARAAANATAPVFAGGGNPAAVVDPDAAKKAKEAAAALRRLTDEVDRLRDQSNPAAAAARELAAAHVTLAKGVAAGVISQKEAAIVYAELAFQMRDQIDPLAAVNRELDRHIELLGMSAEKASIEGQVLDIRDNLRRQGVQITEDETEALRAKLIVEQELDRIAQARDQLKGGSSAEQMKAFMDQVAAMKQLLASGELGLGDVAGALSEALPWANLSQTQEQMAAYVQAHADMYAQIKVLEDAQIINHQTAAMLMAQADAQYNEKRLQNMSNLFGQLATLSSSGNAKLAKIGKAAALVQAVIDGVSAVQKAWASAPYPYNLPAVAITTVTSAANVAAIASQPLPGFRSGGEFTVGGRGGIDSQIVAMRATPGEKVRINTPEQDRALQGGGKGDVTVNSPVSITMVSDRESAHSAMRDDPKNRSWIVEVIQEERGAVASIIQGG